MKNLIFTLIILFLFTTHTQAQLGCEAITSDFSILACLTNLDNCTAGEAPCNDATFDMLFGPNDWGFFFCTNIAPGGGACNQVLDFSALPVELTTFGAKIQKDGIHLNWTTASEINNEGFFIEVSKDGRYWQQLDFIKGNGTTELENKYNYTHRTPSLGVNYFRLKQMDLDGNHAYSDIKVTLWRGGTEKLELVVIPNPVVDQLVPVLPFEYNESERIDYHIYDKMGRLVKSFPSTSKYNVKLSVHELTPSTYTIISNANGYRHSARFVKL